MKLVIVDYGMGNIQTIINAFKHLGVANIETSCEKEVLEEADKLLLPGVGSFRKAMSEIRSKGLDEILKEICLDKKVPILGICLGMQLLGTSSTEDGLCAGLNFVNAKIEKFENNLKIPHVGINQVIKNENSILFSSLPSISDFYFTHSYRMESNDLINPSYCIYGEPFIAAFEKNNIAGTQFHPEISQINGLKIFENFLKLF